MRILHLDTGREMRGGQWQVMHLMRGQRDRGLFPVLMARPGTLLIEEARMLGLETIEYSQLRILKHSSEADVVHCHDAKSHTDASIWAKRPVVVSRRVAFPVKRNPASLWKYTRADLYLAVSHAVERELRRGGVKPERIVIVPDATPVPTRPGRRDGGIVALDSNDPGKGKALIEATGLPVTFVSKLLEALETASIFLYITSSEGLGSGALAAMAHGVPVIASQVGGLPEIVIDGVTGLLVDNNVESIRAAAKRLIENEDLAARLGAAGRQMVIHSFTVDHMVERTIEAYRKVTG